MALLRDMINRVLFPNRDMHAIPVLAAGHAGKLFISSGQQILRCAGAAFEQRETFATAPGLVGPLAVAADGLDWLSGIAVAPGNSELHVTQAWAHRLSALFARGEWPRVVIKNFAGYSARIKADPLDGGWWLAFFGMRTQWVEFVLRERAFYTAMMTQVSRPLWIGPSLGGCFDYREPTQIGCIKKLGIQKPWALPRFYGLVTRIGRRVLALAKGRDLLVELVDATLPAAAAVTGGVRPHSGRPQRTHRRGNVRR